MQQLRFTAVHEDGRHLVLSDPGDGEEYLLEIDERLRDAVRGRRGGLGEHPAEALTPRTVQAMMRAGESAEEVAAATGWPVDRVQRYEAPIVAEREHVATLARGCEVRGRAADGTERPTLESRVRERLAARGVDPDGARWDANRPVGGQWTVLVGFVAGNRDRRAAWRFEPAARHLEALDDEARWLSEDEQALPGGAGGYAGLGGDGTGAVDLVATMRRRSRARGRRRARPGAAEDGPAAVPGTEEVPEELLPLEELRYDPATMGLPPAAHGRSQAAEEAGGHDDGTAGGPAELTGPEHIAEAPEPDAEGESEPGAPQEATLADLFDNSLEVTREERPGPVEGSLPAGQPPEALDHLGERDAENAAEPAEDTRDDEGPAPNAREGGPALTAVAGRQHPGGAPVEPVEPPESAREETGPTTGGDAAERGGSRRRSRPSVPSWDDIMFGARDQR